MKEYKLVKNEGELYGWKWSVCEVNKFGATFPIGIFDDYNLARKFLKLMKDSSK